MGLWLALPGHALAASPVPSAQFDPSDVYFQGYLAVRAAEKLEASGDFSGALDKLQSAGKAFDAVRKYYPAWKSAMVDGRCAKTTETLERIRPQAEAQINKNRNTVAELEGGVKASGKPIDPADKPDPGLTRHQTDPLNGLLAAYVQHTLGRRLETWRYIRGGADATGAPRRQPRQ